MSLDSLYHVLYVSHAARDLRTEEVLALVAQANQRNWLRGLTGALLYSGDCFGQWIEGPEPEVQALMTRIRADARHRTLRVLRAGPLPGRKYSRWGMRLVHDPRLSAIGADEAHHEDQLLALLLPILDADDPTDTNQPVQRGDLRG